MKNIFFVIIVVFIIEPNTIAQTLDYEFKLSERIEFPNDLFLTELQSFDVQQHKMLLTGMSEVVLFNGDSWQYLNPEECHPGFEFNPIRAQFGVNGKIFVTNSTIWGFRFKEDGSCLGAAHKDFRAPSRFSYENEIAGIHTTFGDTEIRMSDETGKSTSKIFYVPNEYPNASFRILGGGIVSQYPYVYYTSSLGNTIYSIHLESGKIKNSSFTSKDFKSIEDDITSQKPGTKLFNEIGRVFKSSSVVTNLFKLNNNHLVVVYQNSGEKFDYKGIVISIPEMNRVSELNFETEPYFIGENKVFYIERESISFEEEQISIVVYDLILNH